MKKIILLLFVFIGFIDLINAQCTPQYPPQVSRYDQCGGSTWWFYEHGTNGLTVETRICRYLFNNWVCDSWTAFGSTSAIFVESGYPYPVYARLRNSCGTGPEEYFYLFGYGPPGLCDAPTGLTNISSGNSTASVFPNPAINTLTVKIDNSATSTYKISLYDMLGKLIINNVTEAGSTTEIDVSAIENGIYALYIDNGISVQREKITVAH